MKKMFALLLSALILLTAYMPAEKQSGTVSSEEYAEDYSESWRERPIPETFDLRSVDTDGDGTGDRCFVPPVRNQRPFGSCWGFAATGAAEISILGSILKHDPDAWTTERAAEGAAEHTIKGLDGSASYEVRVRSYVTVPTMLQVELDYYSEYSDTLTVTVPEGN